MKETLQYLIDGNVLTAQEAYSVMKDIASGKQNEIQIAAFLTIFNMRLPTAEELNGFSKAMLELATPIKFKSNNVLDIVGTGGDGKNTFNISTLACFVCAGAGVKVAKHGNYSVSSVSGSSNVLEHAGISFAKNQSELNEQLEAVNITFLHAPLFHPAMKNVANVRKQLQVKTIFNILGPLVNPAKPEVQVIGVYSDSIAKLYREVLKLRDVNFAIVHALDGYDEISLTADTKILYRKNIQVSSAHDLGFKNSKAAELFGGTTVSQNAKHFINILKGNGTEAQNNVVIANAALGISLYEQNSYSAAIQQARHSLLSGSAYDCFLKLKSFK